MALIIDNTGDDVRRTSSIPSELNFSVIGLGYRVGSGAGFEIFYSIVNSATSPTAGNGIGFDTGPTLAVVTYSSQSNFSATPSNSKWFKWALTCSGTGAGSLIGYWQYLDPTDGTTLYTASTNGESFTQAAMILGNGLGGNWASMRHDNVIVYDAVLTQTQITSQWGRRFPVIRSSIHAWYPFFAGTSTRLLDFSGNGKTLTATGTLTDGAGSPLPWSPYTGSNQGYTVAASSFDPSWARGSNMLIGVNQ